MDLVALILAACAAAVFMFRPDTRLDNVRFGLALLTVALICQFTGLSDHTVN